MRSPSLMVSSCAIVGFSHQSPSTNQEMFANVAYRSSGCAVLIEHLRKPVLRQVTYATPTITQNTEFQSTRYLPTMPHTLSISIDTLRGITFFFLRKRAICPWRLTYAEVMLEKISRIG